MAILNKSKLDEILSQGTEQEQNNYAEIHKRCYRLIEVLKQYNDDAIDVCDTLEYLFKNNIKSAVRTLRLERVSNNKDILSYHKYLEGIPYKEEARHRITISNYAWDYRIEGQTPIEPEDRLIIHFYPKTNTLGFEVSLKERKPLSLLVPCFPNDIFRGNFSKLKHDIMFNYELKSILDDDVYYGLLELAEVYYPIYIENIKEDILNIK